MKTSGKFCSNNSVKPSKRCTRFPCNCCWTPSFVRFKKDTTSPIIWISLISSFSRFRSDTRRSVHKWLWWSTNISLRSFLEIFVGRALCWNYLVFATIFINKMNFSSIVWFNWSILYCNSSASRKILNCTFRAIRRNKMWRKGAIFFCFLNSSRIISSRFQSFRELFIIINWQIRTNSGSRIFSMRFWAILGINKHYWINFIRRTREEIHNMRISVCTKNPMINMKNMISLRKLRNKKKQKVNYLFL